LEFTEMNNTFTKKSNTMKIWKPILATVLFVAMSLATPLFYRWYQIYFEISDESMIGVFFTAALIYIGQLILVIRVYLKHFNVEFP